MGARYWEILGEESAEKDGDKSQASDGQQHRGV